VEGIQITQLGKEITRFFVYYCEGEQYFSLIERFRQADTRHTLLEAIHSFIYFGESITMKGKRLRITPEKWECLCQFIRHGTIGDVRQLHTSMITSVSLLEMEKIHSTEQYLAKLLCGLE
jgi:hypothetical protein